MFLLLDLKLIKIQQVALLSLSCQQVAIDAHSLFFSCVYLKC